MVLRIFAGDAYHDVSISSSYDIFSLELGHECFKFSL